MLKITTTWLPGIR